MPRPLLSGVLAVLVLVTFFLGDALGMTPAGLGAAVAAAAVAAYVAMRTPSELAPPDPASSASSPSASSPSAPRDETPPADTERADSHTADPDTDLSETEGSGAEDSGAAATKAPGAEAIGEGASEPAAEASPSAADDVPDGRPPAPDSPATDSPSPDYAPPPDADAPTGSDGELSNLLPEDLADRYYANFLVPIRQSLPGTRYADLGTIPERIQVLIPDGPSARNALRNAVRAECRSVAVTPDEYMRQFGIYVYSPGQATSGVIVDVPTILHGRASEPSGLSAQALYDRFADHLKALIQQEPSEGMPISIHRNVQSFPLNG